MQMGGELEYKSLKVSPLHGSRVAGGIGCRIESVKQHMRLSLHATVVAAIATYSSLSGDTVEPVS